MSLIKIVSEAMGRIAPLRLAEKWDNVGVLLESPVTRQGANNVLLTIDLTPAVLQEALKSNTSVVVSYHPPIFSGLKSLRLSNPLQNTLLQCAANGISVYTPHTSIDSVWGGINDFLATAFSSPSVQLIDPTSAIDDLGGLGRIAELPQPLPMSQLQESIRKHLGLPQGALQVAYGSTEGEEGMVKTVAICAGSGASVFKGVKADLYWTGEMLHHEVLAAVGQGRNVILCGHTNTERPYLPVLAKKLEAELGEMSSKAVDLKEVTVSVSQADKHPLAIV